MERARGSLSRSTLLLRESILEADGEGAAGEGRRGSGGGGGYGGREGRESRSRGRAEVSRDLEETGQEEGVG